MPDALDLQLINIIIVFKNGYFVDDGNGLFLTIQISNFWRCPEHDKRVRIQDRKCFDLMLL